MQIKTVIFDLDGTLINSKQGIIDGMCEAFRLSGLVVPENLTIPVGPPLYDTILSVYPDIDDKTVELIVQNFRKVCHHFDIFRSKPFEKIVELLKYLNDKNIKVYIATYKPKQFSSKVLERNFSNLYDDIATPSELPTWCEDDLHNNCTKTDIVKFLIDKHKIEAKTAFMVGDAITDIQAGIENGLMTIAANYGYGNDLSCADFGVGTSSELCDLICNLVEKETEIPV